ncbi:hypothetical protein EVAR_63765_1 [Eumeta japonica]|uniref:Uncharacterized protein n=1 Tax=Eumeta variegata TaxID=151549 RepID=A0A4C1ZQB8_EUMVA|nr:hypothetical protein EVAR_63765_1 [Eumeta japonica]
MLEVKVNRIAIGNKKQISADAGAADVALAAFIFGLSEWRSYEMNLVSKTERVSAEGMRWDVTWVIRLMTCTRLRRSPAGAASCEEPL